MPSFQPPLGHTTNIPLPPSGESETFVHLYFRLTFASDEPITGDYEIWTDLPNGDGDWQAYRFTPAQYTSGSNSDIPASPAPTVKISSVSALYNSETVYSTIIVVPATVSIFSYTYRRLHNGKTEWLGNGGSNGIVNLVHQESSKPTVDQTWTGAAVALGHGQNPAIHSIPSSRDIEASLILAHTSRIPTLPVHDIKPTCEESNTPVDQFALAMSPTHVSSDRDLSSVQAEWTVFNSLLAAVPAITKSGLDLVSLPIIHSSRDLCALLYETRARPHLLLYSPSAPAGIAEVQLQPSTAPYLLNDAVFVPTSAATLRLELEAGSISTTLNLEPFIELRDEIEESVWLAAPACQAWELGEEEIAAETKAAINNEDTDDEETVGDVAVEPLEIAISEPVPAWTVFDYLGHFLFALWDLITKPFQSKASVTDECTPLLSADEVAPIETPGLSRATSATAFSPNGTEHIKVLSSEAVKIRSYIGFSFNRGSATFYFPPSTDVTRVLESIQFTAKGAQENDWSVVVPKPSQVPGGCPAVAVDHAHDDQWQVRVERV